MAFSEAFDDFAVIGRQTPHNTVYGDFERHSNASRTCTDLVVSSSLRSRHPDLALTISPVSTCNLLSFASAGQAEAVLDPRNEEYLLWRSFQPPARRLDGALGNLADQIFFARYHYRWHNHDFIVYIVNGARGNAGPYGGTLNNYILHKPAGNETVQSQPAITDELITAASRYNLELHKEILVYDQGWWEKSRELWESVQKASWSDVILDESMKQSLIGDVEGFFDERDTYREFSVPWKVYRAFVTRLHPRHCTILLFMVYVSWWLWVWCTVSLIHYNDGKDFSANNFYVNVREASFFTAHPETAKRSPSKPL